MANRCITTYCFFGEKEVLDRFYKDMQEAILKNPKFLEKMRDPEEYEPWALDNLYFAGGFTQGEIDEQIRHHRYKFCTFDEGQGEDGAPCVWLDVETPWDNNSEDIDKLVERYPGLKIVFSSEVGDVYINTDDSGNFFPNKYYVDWWYDGPNPGVLQDDSEYARTLEEVFEIIAKLTNTTVQDVEAFYDIQPIKDIEEMPWDDYLIKYISHDEAEDELHLNVHWYSGY